MEIHELSALELVAAVRRREVSAREITEHTLQRAQEFGDAVGAFASLGGESALERADILDTNFDELQDLPLLGVPCPIKDLNPVAGQPFEMGSAVFAGNVAMQDDDIAVNLRQAGTVMIGKTNTPELGFPCYTEPDNAPPARTPWDLSRSAGGSSGGAGAAVAAGIVPIAHASDGGGSIRIPASSCGLVGLKVSRGRISSGSLHMPGVGLATNGVLTRTVRDTAIALDILVNVPLGNPYQRLRNRETLQFSGEETAASFLQACDVPPEKLRVGVLTSPVIAEAEVHSACVNAVNVAATLLETLGHEVLAAPVPIAAERWSAFAALWSVGAAEIAIPQEQEHLLRPLTRWLREQGRKVSGVGHSQALQASQKIAWDISQAWEDFDIICTPTLAQPPAKVGELRNDANPAADFAAQTCFTPWTSIYNVAGMPAISLPLHTEMVSGKKLPIGVMLGGHFGSERLLLALASQLESAQGWEHPGLANI